MTPKASCGVDFWNKHTLPFGGSSGIFFIPFFHPHLSIFIEEYSTKLKIVQKLLFLHVFGIIVNVNH